MAEGGGGTELAGVAGEEILKEKQRTVLIAMDGSKHAISAFEFYAKNLYRETDKVIIAFCAEHKLHVPASVLMTGEPAVIDQMMKDNEDHVMETFKTIDRLANKHNIEHTLERLHGPPGESIINAADKQNVDLIIAGSRGHGTVRRTIMGSVSDYIVHHSHIPVMICKHEDEHHKLSAK